MKLKWAKFSLFGFCLVAPIVKFIVGRINEEQAKIFEGYRQTFLACRHCHKLFAHRRPVRLIMHLNEDHKVSEDDAIEVVDRLYREFEKVKIKRGDKR